MMEVIFWPCDVGDGYWMGGRGVGVGALWGVGIHYYHTSHARPDSPRYNQPTNLLEHHHEID